MSYLMFAKTPGKSHELMQSIVQSVYSISASDGSGGSSFAKLKMDEAKVEKRLVSFCLCSLSMICAGF